MSSDIEESPRSSKVEELRAEEETRREKEVNSSWAFGGGDGETEVNIDKRPSLAKTVAEVPSHGPETEGGGSVTLALALDSLSISYSPQTRALHSTHPQGDLDVCNPGTGPHLQEHEHIDQKQQIEATQHMCGADTLEPRQEGTQHRYVPSHRKAFSLPRTLEVVDELGAISPAVPSSQEVESPRSTLLRYGIPYKPYNFHRDSTSQEEDSISGISGLTDFSETRESAGDSGIGSETSSLSLKQTKKGLSDFLSMGHKLISRSSQQVARLIKKDATSPLRTDTSLASTTEAEAVSSSGLIMEARPPGVQPKSVAEEERHQKQHREMMEEARRKEQEEGRERQRKLAEQRRTEEELSSLTSYWSGTVLPGWNVHRNTKKTQTLWWRGLPPPVRGRVWSLALPNSLNLTEQLYYILSARARDALHTEHSSNEETGELIRLDVSRTFPQLGIFQAGGPYHTLLGDVLGAYVCYRPDLGYVQGMSFIAAILLLNLEEAQAFIVFANLVNRPCLSAFYRLDTGAMGQYYTAFSCLLSLHLPKLAKHFAKLGLRPELYMLDWVMTLFSKAAPLDLTCRIWDLLIRDGESFLFKAALGILAMFQDKLMMEQDFILLAQFLSRLPDSLDPDCLFTKIEDLGLGSMEVIFP